VPPSQIRQKHKVESAAERACLEVARRRRATGDLEAALDAEGLSTTARAVLARI
jgi:hypothetical protein